MSITINCELVGEEEEGSEAVERKSQVEFRVQ
jgi:hypothetical protein